MRPEFITYEDIARWSKNIDNDPNIPAGLAESPIIREVCYAGLWLAEELDKMLCNEELITRMQFTAGRLSFGREPWEVAQLILEKYKSNELEFEEDISLLN